MKYTCFLVNLKKLVSCARQTIYIDFVIQNGLLMPFLLRETIYNNFPLQKKISCLWTPPDSAALCCLHILSDDQDSLSGTTCVCGEWGINLQLNCKFSRKNVYILM